MAAITNDAKYDRGVKKLFGAYTEEDVHGDRMLTNEALEAILQDFEICPQLAEWEEVADALHQIVKPEKEGMNFSEFKKFLRKVAVNEFKKKKYNHRFPSHDARHNALLAYLRADDVDALLERARECQTLHSRNNASRDSQNTDDSCVSSRSNKSSSSKKDKKSPSVRPRAPNDGDSHDFDHGDVDLRSNQVLLNDLDTLEERIARKQEEALARLAEKNKEEDEAKRRAVGEIKMAHGAVPAGPASAHVPRPQSSSSSSSSSSKRGARPQSAGRPESAGRGRPESGGRSSGGRPESAGRSPLAQRGMQVDSYI